MRYLGKRKHIQAKEKNERGDELHKKHIYVDKNKSKEAWVNKARKKRKRGIIDKCRRKERQKKNKYERKRKMRMRLTKDGITPLTADMTD
jgi:hypothetical protein